NDLICINGRLGGLAMLRHTGAYTEDEGWYCAQVLDFPAAISQGKTLNSARRNLADALQLMAESYLLDGKALPRPKAGVRDKKADILEPIYLTIRTRVPQARHVARRSA